MYWNLNRPGGLGATPITGQAGTLARGAEVHPERRYRVWLFDGCRTQDYVPSIRSTPGYTPRTADLMVSTRKLFWEDNARTLVAFLDSILAQQSAEQIVNNIDAENVRGAFRGSGLEDNPVIPSGRR